MPDDNVSESGRLPVIYPDYSGITIPSNIAPLNFIVKEPGTKYFVKITSGNKAYVNIKSRKGKIQIPREKWKKLLTSARGDEINIDIYVRDKDQGWTQYETVKNRVFSGPVDPYLTYRLIHPGYERWNEITIQQRNIENFNEWPVIKNSVADQNCVNCHSYNNGKTDDFLFHMRGSRAGTYFYSEGELRKTNLKTPEMKYGSVYPRWHPSGKYVAFSSNNIVQQFHSSNGNKVEVSDLESSLVIYDIDKNRIMPVNFKDNEKYMDTYPEWSPDGKMIYFCRADRPGEPSDYRETRYDLYRAAFDTESVRFVEPELVYNASGEQMSISFPRISPDGRFLVMTLHAYGCFPIWHKEADLISLNLNTLEAKNLELNSDFPESYHSWSSNGRWLLFASRRDDGLTTRPYIAYIDESGRSGKPFIVPRKDPEFYDKYIRSFNLPEFSNVKIAMNPGKIRDAVKSDAIQAQWAVK